MLLDHYLLPVIEISISIIIPLVLTLKTLQITTNTNVSENYSRHVLTYWLTYWFLFCFIQSVGTNNHVRLCFSFFYMVQYKAISPYLIEFYQLTMVPQISNLFLKVMNFHITEEEVDRYATYILEQVCFNDQIIDKVFSIVKLGKGTATIPPASGWPLNKNFLKTYRKASPFGSNMSNHQRAVSGNTKGTPENIIPLEIQKPRAVKSNGVKQSKHPEDQHALIDQKRYKKRSNDNLRSKASSSSLNGSHAKSQPTSRKASKALNGTSRNVSNEDVERDIVPVSDEFVVSELSNSQSTPNFNDSGANLLVHGYNGDPFSKSDSTVFNTVSSQGTQRTEKPPGEKKGIKSFFS